MRRLLSLIMLMVVIAGALALSPAQPAQGQFATNTPEAGAGSSTDAVSAATAIPTSAGASTASGFVPNTPVGPTFTPTVSATATNPPTATFTPTASPTSTPSATPTPNGPFSYPENVNSLTGLEYPNEEARNRVNLVVKVSNYPPIVRPQTGLNMADIVYEYEAEGGVTRFAAIFRSQTPPLVGSVRSGRLMDMELMTMYRANLAYSGTSEPIQRLFLQNFPYRLITPSIGDNCEEAGFCRYPREGLAFEHTLFGEPAKMWEVSEKRGTNQGYKARGFAFNENPDPNGELVQDIFLDWYGQTDARWQYDPASGHYLRYTDGVPHFDKGDGQQLWADNLVVIVVPHEHRPDLFPTGANYESLEVQLWHHDDAQFLYQAVVLRDGQLYQGYWDRPNREDGTALHLIYSNNTPMMLKPGRTWISVVRGLGDVTWLEAKVDLAATATVVALTPSPTPLNIQEGD
jgi:hypothetical protein